MKILVMSSLYPPHYLGGAELDCQSHVEGLQERGHQIFVLTSQWGVETRIVEGNVYRLLNYDRTSLGLGHKKSSCDPLRLYRRRDQLIRALSLCRNYNITRTVVSATQPDVAYVHHMGLVSISPILAAQDMGVPIVIRVPDYWLVQLRTELCEESNPIKRWYRAVFSGLGGFNRLDTRHLIMYNQEFMQSYLQAGFPRESMHVIPIGLPLDLILDNNELSCFPLADQNGDFRLLYAGRLNSSKAPDVAIQALSFITGEMGIRRARLDIIGEGPEDFERKLRDLVTRLGLGERVSFVGKVDFPKLLELYTQYNALLFPSRWIEPFGRSVIEAMARGLPVVATNHGGPAEIISDGENGLLVPPDNPVAMAEAVKKLLLTPELTQRIRCNALATIRAKYSLESIVEQLEAYLETRKRAPLSV